MHKENRMKRIMTLCMAIALAALVSAQETSTSAGTILTLQDFFTKQPAVRVEFLGGAGYAHEPVFPQLWDSSGGIIYNPAVGFNASVEPFFYSISQVQAGFDNLYLSAALYFDWNKNSWAMPPLSTVNLGYFNQSGTEASKIASLGLTYSSDLINFTSTFYYDIDNVHAGSNLFFIEQGLTLHVQNIKARISTLNSWDGNLTNLAWNDLVITDAFISMEKLFDLVSLKIGGNDERTLRIRSLFAPESPEDRIREFLNNGIFYSPFVTQENTGGLASGLVRWLGTTTVDGLAAVKTLFPGCIPFMAVFDFYEKAKLPLKIFISAPIPNAEATISDYLNKQVATIALRYDVKGIGSFDIGWTPGIGYDLSGPMLDTGIWYSPNRQMAQNIYFLDAMLNFDKVKALTILTGLNFIVGEFASADTTSGSGTAANDPIINIYISDLILHYGLEVNYDLSASIKGLDIAAGLYVKHGAGRTFQNTEPGPETFQQRVDAVYPVLTWFRMTSFTEEKLIQRIYYNHSPLVIFLRTRYHLESSVELVFQNIYTNSAGFLNGTSYWNVVAAGAKRPVGFYDSDALSLGVNFTEGLVKLGLELRCKFLLGLPSASDLGYNDAMAQSLGYSTADALYQSQAPATVRYPWSLNVNYTIAF